MREDRPTMWLLAGPNGSGKSTFYANNLADDVKTYVNPDQIAKSLTHIQDQQVRDREAMEMSDRQRQALIREGRSFAAETVFSHISKVDLIKDAKAAGFDVNLVFISTDDPEINLGRIDQRVKEGGHSVASAKVAPRYERALDNLRIALPITDNAYLYDNSVAGKPHRLAVAVERGIVSEVSPQLPKWVERTFPEGVQTYLDRCNVERQHEVSRSRKQDSGLDR
ncbi:MAG: zeta toxin family protein [Herpetosiphonaceae bacterium]|nr:zeta toxin family protein [Herpetosiphonaceae bacterium]